MGLNETAAKAEWPRTKPLPAPNLPHCWKHSLIGGVAPAGSAAQRGAILQLGAMDISPRGTMCAQSKPPYHLSAESELRIVLLEAGRSAFYIGHRLYVQRTVTRSAAQIPLGGVSNHNKRFSSISQIYASRLGLLQYTASILIPPSNSKWAHRCRIGRPLLLRRKMRACGT